MLIPTRLMFLCVFQAVRSFQVALHLHPSERRLWEEDLGWALQLREQQKALCEREKQEEEARRLLVEAPELKSDYDFESDEVIEACTAMADRQKKYEDLKKTAVVVDARGVAKEVIVEDDSEPSSSSQSVLVKARGLWVKWRMVLCLLMCILFRLCMYC